MPVKLFLATFLLLGQSVLAQSSNCKTLIDLISKNGLDLRFRLVAENVLDADDAYSTEFTVKFRFPNMDRYCSLREIDRFRPGTRSASYSSGGERYFQIYLGTTGMMELEDISRKISFTFDGEPPRIEERPGAAGSYRNFLKGLERAVVHRTVLDHLLLPHFGSFTWRVGKNQTNTDSNFGNLFGPSTVYLSRVGNPFENFSEPYLIGKAVQLETNATFQIKTSVSQRILLKSNE